MTLKTYFEKERLTLYNNDCLEVLATMGDESVPLIVTSPPYNLGGDPWYPEKKAKLHFSTNWPNAKIQHGYDLHGDAMNYNEYKSWQQDVIRELWRVLTPDGAIFYNHKPRVWRKKVWLPLDLLPDEVSLHQVIIWARNGGFNYTPTSYMPTHEWILLLTKPKFRLRDQSASGAGDVWGMAQARGNPHPAPFPIELPSTAIKTTGKELVFDPFSGSGTTLLAAKNAGIRGIGSEISEEYCKISEEHIFPNLPLFEENQSEEN